MAAVNSIAKTVKLGVRKNRLLRREVVGMKMHSGKNLTKSNAGS